MEQRFVNTRLIDKARWSLPWLLRYPFWRSKQFLSGALGESPRHVIVLVANHYEPGVGDIGLRRVEEWFQLATTTGNAIRDHDGTPFRHTNFVPAEQYDKAVLAALADLQREGFGEVEVHFHHG